MPGTGRVNEETFLQAKIYFRWITIGIPFYMFGQAMNPIIRSDGSPKFAMASTLAGAGVNIILDPVFIFVFKWGMMGAALAAGCIPVVGFNVGAGRNDRVKALFTRLLLCEAAVGVIALVIVEFFPQQLIGIFGAANENEVYTAFAVTAFRIYLCMMPLATVNKGTFIYLQSVGKAFASTMISLIREVVFGVGFALLLPLRLGFDGVLYSMPVSDILTFIVAAAVIRSTYRQLSKSAEQHLAERAEPVVGSALTNKIIVLGRRYGSGGRSVGLFGGQGGNL